jgi:hypothetical protein
MGKIANVNIHHLAHAVIPSKGSPGALLRFDRVKSLRAPEARGKPATRQAARKKRRVGKIANSNQKATAIPSNKENCARPSSGTGSLVVPRLSLQISDVPHMGL